ncbi:MAG: single-stranded DNA-binding protein [Ilumatobacteraceae bacterium]
MNGTNRTGINVVVIRGTLSGTPAARRLASGSQLLSLEVATAGPDGTASVPVAWFDPPASGATFASGDEVVVRGMVKRRFFRTAAGTQTRTEVVAAEVVGASRRRQVERLLGRAVDQIAGVDDVSRAS